MTVGYIKLHRRLLDWEWYDDINCYRLFTHLLLTVNYEPKKWRGIIVDSGQIITGRETLAKQTGLTEQQTRTALDKLKSTNEITIKTTSNYSIITITNWKHYQQDNQQDNQRITNEQPTNNQRITTTKEGKKERSKEEDIIMGDLFLPDFIPKETWSDFLEMRKKIKKPPTEKALQLLIKTLEKLTIDGNDPKAVLEQSIMNNYQGLFAIKQNGGNKNVQTDFNKPAGHHRPKSQIDIIAEGIAAARAERLQADPDKT